MKLFQIIRTNGLLILPLVIVLIFFYKSILFGQIPFPGDLLVGHYEPYKSQSYNGYAPGGVPHKAQGPDVIRELVPWKKFTIESLKNFSIPFWNPYNFSGNPHMANFQSSVFYPGNLLFLILTFELGLSILIILTPILSAYFTYLFLQKLKLSKVASIFGGLVFSFSLYMTVWLEYGNIGHTLLWLPLLLYFSDKLLEKFDAKIYLSFILAAFVATLAGYIQGLFYVYAVITFYVLLKGIYTKNLNKRNILIFISTLIFPLLFASFQILPTLQIFEMSTRGNYDINQIKNILNPIYYLITVIAPDFFGNPATRNHWFYGTYIERVSYFGLIPIILAIFASISLFKKIEVKIFSIVAIIALSLAFDFFITRFFYSIPIPIISTTIATRILSVFAFAGSILAAYGLDLLIQKKEFKKLFISTGFITLILFAAFIFVYVSKDLILIENLKTTQRNLILPIGNIFAFILLTLLYLKFDKKLIKKELLQKIFIIGIFIVTLFDLFYYFHKITPFSPKDYMYPSTPVISFLTQNSGINRFWGYATGYIDSNFQTFDKTFSVEGNDPLHIKSYTELLSASKNGRVPEELPRPDANIATGYENKEFTQNRFRHKILNITGVKFILYKSGTDSKRDIDTFPLDKYNLVFQEEPWQVYENIKVTPRYFVTNKYEVLESNKTIQRLMQFDFDEQNTIVLNKDPKVTSGTIASNIKLISYTPNKIEFAATSTADALLYLSDNHYPDWRAKVNGKEAEVFVANHTFRAVRINKGDNKIEMYYYPQQFYNGLLISFGSILCLIIFYYFMIMNPAPFNNKKSNNSK